MFSNLAKLAARSLCELPRACQECLVKAREMERAGLLKFPADAGLLAEPARTVPTREEIAEAIYLVLPLRTENGEPRPFAEIIDPVRRHHLREADAVLALLADQPSVAESKAQA